MIEKAIIYVSILKTLLFNKNKKCHLTVIAPHFDLKYFENFNVHFSTLQKAEKVRF